MNHLVYCIILQVFAIFGMYEGKARLRKLLGGGQHLKPLFLRGCSNQCFNPFVEVLCKFGNVFDCAGEMPKCILSVEKATEQYCGVYYPVQGDSNICLWMKPLRVSIQIMKATEPQFLLYCCSIVLYMSPWSIHGWNSVTFQIKPTSWACSTLARYTYYFILFFFVIILHG